MTERIPKGISRRIGCEIVAALAKAPRTIYDLVEMVGCSEMVARYWVDDLRESGLVRICAYEERVGGSSGRRCVRYEWQARPFELPDAPAQSDAAEVA